MLETKDYIEIDSTLPDNKTLIRPHQYEAVQALEKYFELDKDIPNRKGLLVMPTGSGKTYTAISWLLKDAVTKGYTVVWIVHRQELIKQTHDEFNNQAPLLKGSKIKKFRTIAVSGLEGHCRMAEASGKDVYVLSRQSAGNDNGLRFLPNMLKGKGKKKVVVVIDEAHHGISSQYRKIWDTIRKINPNAALLGLTATPTRVSENERNYLNTFFHVNENIKKHIGVNGYIHQVTLKELIKSGFLAVPKYIPRKTDINVLSEFKFSEADREYLETNKEWSPDLENQFAESAIRNKAIVNEYFEHKGRKEEYGKTIVFAVNRLHAEILCELFNKEQKGIAQYVVSGKPGTHEILEEFKNNKFKVLINVQILTEGNDIPDVETIFLTRETSSDIVLMQMIGRGLRGLSAGGTAEANIVAFHDVWDRYNFWLEPSQLDVFEDVEEEELQEEEEELPEIIKRDFPEQEVIVRQKHTVQEDPWKELYLRYYYALSLSGTLVVPAKEIMPIGWYQVNLPNDTSRSILAYNDQMESFRNVGLNVRSILKEFKGTLSRDVREKFNRKYFANHKISDMEAFNLIRHIIKNGHMPPFFSFKDLEGFEPHVLGAYLKENFKDMDARESWLEVTWNANPVLRSIYKLFINFKITALNAMKNKVSATIVKKQDPKQEYKIVDNYYDLKGCLDEVLAQYPKISAEGLIQIQWSKKIPGAWYALCQMSADGKLFQITVNRLLSSPMVNRELIKYLIFHELLHQNGYWKHDKDFRSREWQYPNSANWDAFLDGVLPFVYDTSAYQDLEVGNEIPALPKEFFTKKADDKEQGVTVPQSVKEPEKSENVSVAIDFTIETEDKLCPNCGSKLPKRAKFCMECGSKL